MVERVGDGKDGVSVSGCGGGAVGGWGWLRRLGHALPGRSCLHHSRWPVSDEGTSEGLVMNLLAELKHYL